MFSYRIPGYSNSTRQAQLTGGWIGKDLRQNLTKLSRLGQCTFATLTSNCPNPPHQNELDKCQISLSVAWKMSPVHNSLHPSKGSQLISHLPLQLDWVSKTWFVHDNWAEILQSTQNPLASKVTHTVLCARSVFAVLLLTGQDET